MTIQSRPAEYAAPYGAGVFGGMMATKMPLLTELGTTMLSYGKK